jgi:hypothetical protein
VMFSTKGTYFGCGNTQLPHPSNLTCRAKEEVFVKAQMLKYRSHPALLGWYINDELKPEWVPDLEAHYQWTKETDPNHPAWSVLFEANELRSYMRTFDVVGSDPYPITAAYTVPNASHAGQAGQVGSQVDLTRSQTDASRPVVRSPSAWPPEHSRSFHGIATACAQVLFCACIGVLCSC